MNDTKAKMLLQLVKPFLTPETIKGATDHFLQMGIDYINAVPLEPGEDEATAIIHTKENMVYVTVCTVDQENKPVRYIITKSINELIDLLIKKL